MVSFYNGSIISAALAQTGLSNAPSTVSSLSNGGSGGSGSSINNCCGPSSTKFLEKLTTKLITMTTSLKQQFEDLKNNQKEFVGPPAPRLVEITVKANISVKHVYYMYLRRYGPPINGIFDPDYIRLLQAELDAGMIFNDSSSDSDSD